MGGRRGKNEVSGRVSKGCAHIRCGHSEKFSCKGNKTGAGRKSGWEDRRKEGG